MGDVILFPSVRTEHYDRRAVEVLRDLPPPRTDRLTYLGSSELSEDEVAVFARVLQEHRALQAIRVLGERGQDLVIFRGQLPLFRTF